MSITRLKCHPRVASVQDERDCGEGVFVTLKRGWSFDPHHDNRVRSEDTTAEALAAVETAYKFNGPYTA